ncbi:MAG TPA: NAD(P)(+) transhydrogenase (Re/Si-specific) subunit beta [Leptospiraceae bacterium]|nr:NAD(P)(+) transhydrogenase (Re/Si-specific) subunit beta [Leptospiraceae bacterium]HMY68726.1 NAD(P)(+) transhydrogenase (Re/Si-specific) subunit beta [Leptospiraceae bacterium]HNF25224.1 NAD(P)(+) transhydrogenase (Re/Si-specific) subunit beta [Leptospiraceae bacterium]HNI98668.1 NAD(P)(+) transhydrogenase (Re/Si-specific) subunit beta [Leptospiraceae bacterium]HNM02296.1 NAD(P)(+) transhydrogenase (Re/Si-specific) subunit beta [Leptospiraceae bacterium]
MDWKVQLIKITYLLSSVLFILGIKLMGKTESARKGNLYSMIAMLLAIGATLLYKSVLSYEEILLGLIIGTAIGGYFAKTVEMTSMPEMVAIFNGVGGLASLLVAISEFYRVTQEGHTALDSIGAITIGLSVFVGGITFTGSYIAFAKLNGTMTGKAIMFKGQHLLNLLLALISMIIIGMSVADTKNLNLQIILSVLSLILGVLVVIPIGGADMPVVISLLNSYSGIAGCATGFVLNNYVLVIAGALVGSSGIILTNIMCKAMNRSLLNVILGGFGQTAGGGAEVASSPHGNVKELGVDEVAMLFDSASSVIIIPGYGMAVAQAQHTVRELMNQLEKKGITVKFAIHPVAGRMPGHMNVLLAEAEVPYDKLVEMDEINSEFSSTDVVLVIGANDIVNPAARTNPASPIYGMPILNADKAKNVIISKRSMAAGYAGIDNELFTYPNAFMFFGDAKASLTKLVNALGEE